MAERPGLWFPHRLLAVVHKHLKMADDQGTKTTSIDNLINELTKQKSPQPAPFVPKPVSPSVTPQPQPFVPKPVVPPMPAPAPKPIMPPPFVPKPAPQPMPRPAPVAPSMSATPVPPPSPVKEYQSSIRTMSEDMSSLKTGQKPSGVSMPRTVEPPKPIAPPPAGGLPKPPVSPVIPGTQVKLGESQKTGPMAPSKIPTPVPAPKKMEMPQIVIPEGGKKMGSNFLYLGILVIVILAGAAYWFFMIRTPAVPVAEVTPTPTATPTPVATLNQLLSDALPVSVDLSASTNPLADFNTAITAQTVSGGTLEKLNIKINAEGTEPSFADIMDKFLISYPAQLKTNLGAESVVLLYGQKEMFTAKGLPDTSATNVKKLIFVTEVNDLAMAASISQVWEPTMVNGFKGIFGLDTKKAASKTFLSNSYRETDIKYMNFTYPDKSLDYTAFLASNNKLYLIISNSREAVYGIIDKLK